MKLSNLISISPGFHRSINVKYDLHNSQKISNYIPTEKSELVLEHFLSAVKGDTKDSASMLIGSYGTGKSHLATFLGSLLGKQISKEYFDPITEKIKKPRVRDLLKEETSNDKPFLIVPIIGESGEGLSRQLLSSLKRSLDENKIEVKIKSGYTAALERIETWKKDFPEVFKLLKVQLLENSISLETFIQQLDSFKPNALALFEKIYPTLTAGADFNFFTGDVAEIYHDVGEDIVKQGYRGILLIFDEFNKVLDNSFQDSIAFQTLQNLAELAGRSDEEFRLYMVLVSHRTIGQYLSEYNNQTLSDEWLKIEGRFKIFDVSNLAWETYDLISRVLNKSDEDFYKIITKYNQSLLEIGQHRRLPNLFDGLQEDVINNVIVKGGIPLHPTTVFILTRVSSKLAQNERTLFTFLSGQDGSPLIETLETNIQDLQLIMPWQVFDYFEGQIELSKDEHIKKVWTKVMHAIDSLPNNAIAEIQMLKTIGIFQIVSNPNLQCTTEMIEYALGNNTYQLALNSLIERKMIYVRKSSQEIEIVEQTSIDIEKEIENWLVSKPIGESGLKYLTKLGLNNYVIPHSYNHQNKITRYLTPAYADIRNINSIINDGILSPEFDGCDGIICYLFPESREEIIELEQIVKGCKDQRAFFVLPNHHLDINSVILRFLALHDLAEKAKSKYQDPKAETLINLYLNDSKQDLENKINLVTLTFNTTVYYWNGVPLKDIKTERDLSNVVSSKMKKIYKHSPIINNELVNKNAPTLTSRRARNDVIDLILQGYPEIRERLRSSQEEFMFDTLFVKPGLFSESTNEFIFNADQFKHVFKDIEENLLTAKTNPISFESIIKHLISPKFGIRKGLIPVLLAASIVKFKEYITIRDSAEMDCHINAKLLDDIVESPNSYTLRLDEWNEASKKFTTSLAQLWGKELGTEVFFANKFADLADELFRWFTNLPRVARETTSISKQTMNLRRFCKIANKNPKQIILKDLPKSLGYAEYSVDDVDELLKITNSSKNELENVLVNLQSSVKDGLRKFFASYGSTEESLISLARNMVDEIKTKANVNAELFNVFKYISSYEGYDDDKFTYGLAQILTGFRLEDWLDQTASNFHEILSNLENSCKQIASTESEEKRVELIFVTADKKLPLFETQVSALGLMLQAHLESSVENFGDAISPLEKQQIVLNVLKKYMVIK